MSYDYENYGFGKEHLLRKIKFAGNCKFVRIMKPKVILDFLPFRRVSVGYPFKVRNGWLLKHATG